MSSGSAGGGKGVLPFAMPSLADTSRRLTLNHDVEKIERDAYEKGFAAGEKAGFTMGEQRAMVLIDKVEALLKDLATLKQSILQELEPSIVTLSISVARQILMRELTATPEDVVSMTREAMMKIERTGQIMIKINPSVYDLFMKHKPELLTIHPDISFDIDPSVSRYGTVVLGPEEEVVTDIDEQILNLVKDMSDRLASH